MHYALVMHHYCLARCNQSVVEMQRLIRFIQVTMVVTGIFLVARLVILLWSCYLGVTKHIVYFRKEIGFERTLSFFLKGSSASFDLDETDIVCGNIYFALLDFLTTALASALLMWLARTVSHSLTQSTDYLPFDPPWLVGLPQILRRIVTLTIYIPIVLLCLYFWGFEIAILITFLTDNSVLDLFGRSALIIGLPLAALALIALAIHLIGSVIRWIVIGK